MYRQAHMKNIQALLTIHPEATLVDLYLLTRLTEILVLPDSSEEDCRMTTESRQCGERSDCDTIRMEPGTNSYLPKQKS